MPLPLNLKNFQHTIARANSRYPGLARRYVEQSEIFLRMGFSLDEHRAAVRGQGVDVIPKTPAEVAEEIVQVRSVERDSYLLDLIVFDINCKRGAGDRIKETARALRRRIEDLLTERDTAARAAAEKKYREIAAELNQ